MPTSTFVALASLKQLTELCLRTVKFDPDEARPFLQPLLSVRELTLHVRMLNSDPTGVGFCPIISRFFPNVEELWIGNEIYNGGGKIIDFDLRLFPNLLKHTLHRFRY